MNIESLRYLIALEKSESFSEAAESAHISQQGFGKAISALEKELGVRLVERGPLGATLTRPGLLCLESAKKMYAEYANLVALLPAVAAEEEGEERRIPWLATSYVSHSIIALKPDEAFDRLSTQEVGFREGLQMIRENPQTPVLTAEVFPETQRELRDAGYVFEPFSGTMLGVICKSGQLDERITCLEKEAVLDLPLVMYSGKPFAAFAQDQQLCLDYRLRENPGGIRSIRFPDVRFAGVAQRPDGRRDSLRSGGGEVCALPCGLHSLCGSAAARRA